VTKAWQRRGGLAQLNAVLLLTLSLAGCGDDALETTDSPTTSCRTDIEMDGLTLDESFCTVADLTLNETDVTSLALAGDQLLAFQQSTDAAAGLTSFSVDRYGISFADGLLEQPEQLLSAEVSIEGSDTLFGGGYVAFSQGNRVAVGYTRSSDFGGAIFYGAIDEASDELTAPGNFDAAWLDSETLLVHGSGLEQLNDGTGVYVWQLGSTPRKLIEELGEASSFIAIGPEVVFVGESAWPNNRVHAFTRAELTAAIASTDSLTPEDADLVYDGAASDMAALGNDLLVLDITYDAEFNASFNGIHAIAVDVQEDTVQTLATTDLLAATESATAIPAALATSGELLGIVRTTAAGTNVTVVRAK
jgi:hypothetical protein